MYYVKENKLQNKINLIKNGIESINATLEFIENTFIYRPTNALCRLCLSVLSIFILKLFLENYQHELSHNRGAFAVFFFQLFLPTKLSSLSNAIVICIITILYINYFGELLN